MADLISVLRASGGGYGERGVVALVAHWGVLHALTGRQPELTLTLTRGLITRVDLLLPGPLPTASGRTSNCLSYPTRRSSSRTYDAVFDLANPCASD